MQKYGNSVHVHIVYFYYLLSKRAQTEPSTFPVCCPDGRQAVITAVTNKEKKGHQKGLGGQVHSTPVEHQQYSCCFTVVMFYKWKSMISQNVAYALIYSLFEATPSMRLHELVCTVHTNTRARAPTHHINTPGDKWAELSGRNFIQSGASIECCCWAASCSLFVVCFSFIATQRTERSQHSLFLL